MEEHGGVAPELVDEADLSTPAAGVASIAPDPTNSRPGASVRPQVAETAERPVLAGVPPVSDQPGVGREARTVETEDAGVGALSSTRIRTHQDRLRTRRSRLAA